VSPLKYELSISQKTSFFTVTAVKYAYLARYFVTFYGRFEDRNFIRVGM
jgi:hypothetical protein